MSSWRGDQTACSSCGWFVDKQAQPVCHLELLPPLLPVMQWEMGTALCCMLLGSDGFSVACNSPS